jgi:AbiV family abortive infection protein
MAVKAASRPKLAACAIATAKNAQGLLQDAELLARSGHTARAYSMAVLAIEASGKAASLATLAVMPKKLRAQAPVGRILTWHQLKLVGGLLIAVLPPGSVASRLDVMPDAEVEHILSTLDEPADRADRLKRRGFYVDMDRNGRIREPSEITESEVDSQLGQARQAVASASVLLSPDAQASMANPAADQVELAQELVSALNAAGYARTPKAAAGVILRAVRKFRARKATTSSPLLLRSAAEWREGGGPAADSMAVRARRTSGD